jgi:hypothetical protein
MNPHEFARVSPVVHAGTVMGFSPRNCQLQCSLKAGEHQGASIYLHLDTLFFAKYIDGILEPGIL